MVDTNEKCAKYLEEMKDYLREELREVIQDSSQPGLKRTIAKNYMGVIDF